MSRRESIIKFESLRKSIEPFKTFEEAYGEVINIFSSSTKTIITSFANAHAFNLSLSDSVFFNHLIDSDFIMRDGIGVKIDSCINNRDPGCNLNGTDFIPYFLGRGIDAGIIKKIMLIGATETNCQSAVRKLSERNNIQVIGLNGYQDRCIYKDAIISEKPDMIILGMGMPRQEELSVFIRNSIPHRTIVFNGGAIIDFISGNIPRAPIFFRQHGIEWVYRLYLEPRRLFKRYIFGNATFIMNSLACRLTRN